MVQNKAACDSIYRITLVRFKKNVPGVVALWYVAVMIFIAIFAYLMAPDNTANANTMHLALSNKNPGFSIALLQTHVPRQEENHFFKIFSEGRKNLVSSIPVSEYKVNKDSISYREYIDQQTSSVWKLIPISAQTTICEKTFYLGTDRYGRDLLSRMIVGSRISLTIGFIAVAIALVIGIILGALAGYYGKTTDAAIMWFINVMWSIPTILMIIAITMALGKGMWQVYVAVGLTTWVELARVVRGQVISTKKMQYVEAAKALGYSNLRIILRHILPNLWGVIIVICASNFATAILMESGLSFLGLGAQPPVPSWGGIIRDHYTYMIMGKPFLALVPGVAILLLVLALITFGNALRDALDYKQKN